MKSIFISFLTICLVFVASSFQSPDGVTLTCKVNACQSDSLYLLEFDGFNFMKIDAAPKQKDGMTYEFEVAKTNPRIYYVGLGGGNIKPFIIGTEQEITLQGNCNSFRNARLPNSTLNTQYTSLKNQLNKFKNQMGVLIRQYQGSMRNPAALADITKQMGEVDKERIHLLDSVRKVHPYLGKVAELNTYLSFQNYGKEYKNEPEYFAKEFFKFANWEDEDYSYLPWVYENWKVYAATMCILGLTPEKHFENLNNELRKIPAKSRTYKLAMGGLLAGLKEKTHPNYVPFAKIFIEQYRQTDRLAAATVSKELNKMKAFAIGGEAPDFTMDTPEGEAVSLSDFRGKVLLVDFWASWCGPCRRENPHVVKLYNKYKDQGFDVLGVSLDKDKGRWLAAIEKDGLAWNHVSDLKYWSNAAAQLYGVKGIPHTVLLDREGKIIAHKLRGAALEAKLKEIFGS